MAYRHGRYHRCNDGARPFCLSRDTALPTLVAAAGERALIRFEIRSQWELKWNGSNLKSLGSKNS
jgi:hypothetical protein